VAFSEFLRARRTARSFAHHQAHGRRDEPERDDAGESDETLGSDIPRPEPQEPQG